MKQADITWLIIDINTDVDVTAIIAGRLYRWIPMKIPGWIYMTVSPRLEYQYGANKKNRLRFRCIWHNNKVKFSELQDLMTKVIDSLEWKALTNRYWFGQWSTYYEDYIDWNRPMIEFSMFGYLVL